MKDIFGVIFTPGATWDRLAALSDAAIKRRLMTILLMAMIPPIGFYYGTTVTGWTVGDDGSVIRVTAESAIPLAVLFYLALVVAAVFIGAMAHWMSKTYDADSFAIKGVVMIGYAAMPVYLSGLFAFYPIWWLDILVATAASCYTVRLVYLGVPPMMKVPEDRGMLYASALFAVALVYAVVGLVSTVILWEYVAEPVFVDSLS